MMLDYLVPPARLKIHGRSRTIPQNSIEEDVEIVEGVPHFGLAGEPQYVAPTTRSGVILSAAETRPPIGLRIRTDDAVRNGLHDAVGGTYKAGEETQWRISDQPRRPIAITPKLEHASQGPPRFRHGTCRLRLCSEQTRSR